GEDRGDVVVERRCADDPGDPLALQVGDGLDPAVLGGDDRQDLVGGIEEQGPDRLRAPVRRAELVDAFLGQVAAAHAVGGELHLAGLDGKRPGNVVFPRKYAQTYVQFLLERVADR